MGKVAFGSGCQGLDKEASESFFLAPGQDLAAIGRYRQGVLPHVLVPPPGLLLPAIQVNIRAGRLPEAEPNGTAYLRIPLNRF